MAGVRVVMMGTGGVGKSALTVRFVKDTFLDEYDPTVEDSYSKSVMIGKKKVTISVLDTAGQEEFKYIVDQWMQKGNVIVLVYDVTEPTSFKEAKSLREQVKKVRDDQPPIVLVANKIDLQSERVISESEGKNLATEWSVPYIESSAKTAINVDTVFTTAASEVMNASKAGDGGCCILQ